MANQIFNIAKGKFAYYGAPLLGLTAANSRLVMVILDAAEVDDTLNNYDDLAAVLVPAGNTESLTTNYARKEVAAAGVTYTLDDTGNDAQISIDADQVFTTMVQTGSESWVKALICYDADNAAGTDSDIIPLSHHDITVTPNGGNITVDVTTNPSMSVT